MDDRCEICGGSRVVRFPARKPIQSAVRARQPVYDGPTYREFPCPACSPVADENRIIVAESLQMISARDESVANYRRAMEREAAEALALHLLESGYITFSYGPVEPEHPSRNPDRMLRASIGVFTPEVAASIEQRIAERQDVVAKEVAPEAAALINTWGSAYGWVSISKDMAIRFIEEALEKVLARRSVSETPHG